MDGKKQPDPEIQHLYRQREFRKYLRDYLPEYLLKFGYLLIHDNINEDQSINHNHVFRLEYLGKNKIAIYNDDYRDYTEYFKMRVNDEKEFLLLNLDKYDNILNAFEDLKTILNNYL
jgi:hypothetical protein